MDGLAQEKQTDEHRASEEHRAESGNASRADDTRDTQGLQGTRRASFGACRGGIIGDRDARRSNLPTAGPEGREIRSK